jgi:prophage DNA circulation protein
MSGALATIAGAVSNAWLRLLRPASFRGVPFYYERVTHTHGRRYAMHQYPGRDVPYAEDLGRSQREWSFSAYVIGDTFHAERMALLRACEEAGPGSLILPFVGRVEAVCTEFTFEDARGVGRHSAISLSFAEAGQEKFPSGAEDTHSQIGGAAEQLGSAERGAFVGGFSVGSPVAMGIPIAPIFAAMTTVSTLASAASTNVRSFAALMAMARMPTVELDQAPLTAAIDRLTRQADNLVYASAELFDAVDHAFETYTDAHTADAAFVGMLTLAATYTAQQVPVSDLQSVSTPELRAAEVRNADLFQSLVRRLALRELGYAVPGVDLDNTEHAVATRRVVFDAFTAESDLAADTNDDDLFAALINLAQRLLDDLDNRAAQLPSLAWYRTARSFNAITLAYQLYADAERNLEIVTRVGAINPAFMPLNGRVLHR